MTSSDSTRQRILDAARECVVTRGLADLSTRMIAETAQVPVSLLHYHFGGKQGVLVGLFERENERLLARQAEMFSTEAPLWERWEQACDFLDEDLRNGFVLILQQMMAAGWTDPEIAALVRDRLHGWFALLADVARSAERTIGGLGPFTADEVAALVGDAFLGAEATILLGLSEDEIPSRSALRRIGSMIRVAEEAVGMARQ